MQSYSYMVPEKDKDMYAFARAEDINASYKDLTQVCARVRGKPISWALSFLEKARDGTIPVLYQKFNTKLGHRKELNGRKGRYPKKAAGEVLKVVKSAAANARVKGISEDLTIIHISANKKATFPRGVPKGRRGRSDYETARVEIVVKGPVAIEKKVAVRAPEKPQPKEAANASPKDVSAEKPNERTDQLKPAEVKKEEKHAKPQEEKPLAKKVTLPKKAAGDSAKKVPLAGVKKEKKEE